MTRAHVVPTPALARAMPWFLGALALAVFGNALANGFALDDEGIIRLNPLVHSIDGAWRAFVTPYWPNGAGQYRPLVIASFSVEWAAWGARPLGFHAVNMLWHAAATVLMYALARRWLSFGGAVIAAVVFAIHPVHVEAVANVVGRSELMAATGVLAALLLHERRSPWSVLAFALALLSKEHAIVTPALAVLMDLARGRAPRAAPPPPVWRLYAGYGAVAVAWGALVAAVFAGRPFSAVDPLWLWLDPESRWLTMLGVIPAWVRLWFFPHELIADYSPRVTAAWPNNLPDVFAGASLMLIAVAGALIMRRHARAGVVALGWLAITMLPIANLVVPTGVIVAERTLYLSSAGAVLLIGAIAERAASRWRAATLAIVGVLAVAGVARTWSRTPVWMSHRSVLLTTAAQRPEASWTHVLLGRVYAGNRGYAQAVAEYRRALVLFPYNALAWSEAIHAAASGGDLATADSLVAHARVYAPGDYVVSVAHAYVALERQRFSEAVRVARAARAMAPDSATPRLFEGLGLMALGAPDSARRVLDGIARGHPLRARADSLLSMIATRAPQ